MDKQSDTARLWAMAEDIGICMLASHEGELIRSRPMAAHVDKDAHAFFFLTDASSHKEEEIARNPNVALIFAEPKAQRYVSINGVARISDDRARIKDLWSTAAKAFWDDPEDPEIRVLEITPQEGQYWDGPGRAVTMIEMLAASLSGSRPDLGDNKTARM